MIIVAHISRKGVPVADVTYRSGLHVEVRVAAESRGERFVFALTHSQNPPLEGNWEEALDRYFNEDRFDSKAGLLPGEMRRVGSAKEHKSLFRSAVHSLMKDLEPHGHEISVEFL